MAKFYSFSHKCLICNREFQNLGRWKKHIFGSHPEEYIDVILKNFSVDYKEDPFAWKILRELILKRDNYTCQICGKRAEVVHHKKYHDCQKEDFVSVCDDCGRRQTKPRSSELLWQKSKKTDTVKEELSGIH